MFLSDATYFARRASSQLELAANAFDDDIGRVHLRLSDLYLERARDLLTNEMNGGWSDNVVPIRVPA